MNKDSAELQELLAVGEKEIAEGKGHFLEDVLREADGLLEDQRSSDKETE